MCLVIENKLRIGIDNYLELFSLSAFLCMSIVLYIYRYFVSLVLRLEILFVPQGVIHSILLHISDKCPNMLALFGKFILD